MAKTNLTEQAKRAALLRTQLTRAADLYYNRGAPDISDDEYDAIYRELLELESADPDLVTADSPTQRVGAPLPKGSAFEKADHIAPMLSIESLTEQGEVAGFVARARKYLGIVEATASPEAPSNPGEQAASPAESPGPPVEPAPTWQWALEPKLDGISANILYEDGILVRGLSRGDGHTGEDITRNLRTIRNLPLRLTVDSPPSRIEVRGEVIMAREAFAKLQAESILSGDTPFRNARNTVAGTLKLLDPKTVASRKIEFLCFGVGHVEGVEHSSHSERREFLAACGFQLAAPFAVVDGVGGILDFHARLEAGREQQPFELDGIVAKVDDIPLQRRLGRTARAPRWTLAYKFAPRRAQTEVLSIESQVGRTGVITPVAHLQPVDLAGVTVSRATLHNWGLVKERDVRKHDVVTIERAGDVIPAVVEVDLSKRGPNSTPTEPPRQCPACATPLEPDGAFLYCINVDCTEQLRGRIVHFTSRRALDLRKLGDKQIDQLVEAGILQHLEDVFLLPERRDAILALDRFGEKSVDNLIDQIERAKRPALARFVHALGIRRVGEQTAKDLADVFETLDKLQAADKAVLLDVHGVGSEVAESILHFFSLDQTQRFFASLASHGVVIENKHESDGGEAGDLKGLTFCFTGGMNLMSRDEARALVEARGARTSSSVTKKVTHVVAGDGAGSKLDKAKKLELEILDEEGFAALIGR